MRFGLLLVLVLVTLVSFGSSQAWAHEGAALLAQEAAAANQMTGDRATGRMALDRTGEHQHGRPGTPTDCLAVGGCSSAGSVLGETCYIPVPLRVGVVTEFSTASSPRSIDPPLEDQPPRTT